MVESRLAYKHLCMIEINNNKRLFVVMGVAGCGKSTVGNALVGQLGGTYLEGDEFHPMVNIKKMSNGEPLTDEDRWPWLKIIAQEMSKTEGLAFTGCSALKRSYRDLLRREAGEGITFIHLSGSKEVIADRMKRRAGHFMPTDLLDSQFAALEPLSKEETSITVDISFSQQRILDQILSLITDQNKGN